MSQVKLSGKALVIQIDSKHIRIAQTVLGSTAPQLFAQTVVDTPEGAVDDGALLNVDAVKAVLRAAIDGVGLGRIRQVVFSLCTSRVITEEITAPRVSGSRLDALLQANLDMYFPAEVRDYLIAYETSGDAPEKGATEQKLRLWATPRGLVAPYYTMANSLGLSVAAIEWFGHSLVNSVGASFGATADKKKKKQPRRSRRSETVKSAEDPFAKSAESFDSMLYIDAEPEFLLMTFVNNGRVALQRLLRQDGSAFSEAQIVLDYYRATDYGRSVSLNGCLVGSVRELSTLAGELQEELEIPIRIDGDGRQPDWYLCTGAAMAPIDFGSSSFNRVVRASDQMHQLWQYALVLAGGVAVAAAVMGIVVNRMSWTSKINAEQSRQEMIMMQMQLENNKYAEVKQQQEAYEAEYQSYLMDYTAYSRAYENLFGASGDKARLENAVRTYNGNLILMLTELERILPAGTSTVTIGIGDEGMGLEFACMSKEETAKLIQELRNMRYASLEDVKSLALGEAARRQLRNTGYGVLPSLQNILAEEQAQAEAERAAQAEAAAAQAQNAQQETPTGEGTATDNGYLRGDNEEAPKNGGAVSAQDYSLEERRAAVYKVIAEDDEGWDCFLQAMLDESGSQDAAYIQQVANKARSILSGGGSSLSAAEKSDLVEIGLSIGSVKSAIKNRDKDALDSLLSPYRHTLAKVMAIDEDMLFYTEELFASNAMLEAKYESYLASMRPTEPVDEYDDNARKLALRQLFAGDDEGWDLLLNALTDGNSGNTDYALILSDEIRHLIFADRADLTNTEQQQLVGFAANTGIEKMYEAIENGDWNALDRLMTPYRSVLTKAMTADADIIDNTQRYIQNKDLLQAKYESHLAEGNTNDPTVKPEETIEIDTSSGQTDESGGEYRDDSGNDNELKESLKDEGLIGGTGRVGSSLSRREQLSVGEDGVDIFFAAILRYKENLIQDEYKSKVKMVEAPEKLPLLEQYATGGETR